MNAWIAQIFESDIANNGGVVRRSVGDVEKYASSEMLITEVRRRGFHAIETGGQFVILCHTGSMSVHC